MFRFPLGLMNPPHNRPGVLNPPQGGGGTPPAQVAPAFTTQPALLGSTALGSTITVSLGAASGTPAPTLTGTLTRPGKVPAAVLDGATFSIEAADQGGTITLDVTAANSAGSVTAGATQAVPAAGPSTVQNVPDGGYIGTTATIDPATGRVGITNVRTDIISTEDPRFGVNQWVVQVDGMAGKNPACDLLINGSSPRNGDTGTWQGAWAESLNGPWHKFDSVTSDGTNVLMRHSTPAQTNTIYIAGLPLILQPAWDSLMAGWTENPFVRPTPSGGADYVVGTLPAIPARNIPAKPIKGFCIGTGEYFALLTTGVHSEEHIGQHAFVGFVDFLLSNDPVAVNLRNRFTFFAYPGLNPQARHIGAARLEVETALQNANRIFDPSFNNLNLSRVMREIWMADLPAAMDVSIDFHDNPFGSNYAAEMLIWNAQALYDNVLAARQARLPGSPIKVLAEYAAPNSIGDYAYKYHGARVRASCEHGYPYNFGPDDWKLWGVDFAKGLWATYENPPAKPGPWQDITWIPRGAGITVSRDTNGDYLIVGNNVTPIASMEVPAGKTIEVIFEGAAPGSGNTYVRRSSLPGIESGSSTDLTGNIRGNPFRYQADFTATDTPVYVGIVTNISSGTTRTMRLLSTSRWRVIP